MTEIAQQYIAPAIIGGIVVIVGKLLDIIHTKVSKASGKHVDKKTFDSAIKEIKETFSDEIKQTRDDFTENRPLCQDVIKLTEEKTLVMKQLEEIQTSIRKSGEITSNSLVYLAREKEYKAAYIGKKRELRKYFVENSEVFKYSVKQLDTIASLALRVSEDYLNTKILNIEDRVLIEHSISEGFEKLTAIGTRVLGENFFNSYAPILEKGFDIYVEKLTEIFLDTKNDKIQRIHTVSMEFIDEYNVALRDSYFSKLTGELHA